jgi:Ca2+-binding RTX toxin-like protein
VIEDVRSGEGADFVVGNDADNTIATGRGDDVVIAGNGRDVVILGPGSNKVDLFEEEPANDFIVFDDNPKNQFIEVYNFEVGGTCDALVFECDGTPSASLSDVLASSDRLGDIRDDIYRIEDFDPAEALPLLSASGRDVIILAEHIFTPNFDVDVFFYDVSSAGAESLLHVASIETNGSLLGDWSLSNFILL